LHPVSRAVVSAALARGLEPPRPTNVQEKPGLGVVAIVDGQRAVLGRSALLSELGINVGMEANSDASQVWVALGQRCLGRFVLRDQPRPEARAALEAMRKLGITRLILLTGDRAAAAKEVGNTLGMDEVIAEVLPAQKLEVVRAEQAAGRTVMMVGDGVNDAPALGGADVGVAIGAELNEIALGGADVALLGTDLGRLPKLIGLADKTRQVIGQNVWLAFALSVVLIALAARGVLDPLTGALWQSVAVLVIVGNSARILRFGGPVQPAAKTSRTSVLTEHLALPPEVNGAAGRSRV
jgi:P-type E1-E2 ATPase